MSLIQIGYNAGADLSPDLATESTNTAVADAAAVLTAIDAFAAAVIAITGDTYTAHQFGGAASTGLTAAQCNTLFKSGADALNTAITDFLAVQAEIAEPNDVWLSIDTAKVTHRQDIVLMSEAINRYVLDGRTATLTD